MRIVALAGGVGGAKLAHGLAQVLPPPELTIIVNTGDDFEHLGLQISPDLDTVCYTLAGLANPEAGWGRAGETWHAISALEHLGGPGWFRVGDRDLGTHLERTRRRNRGEPLSKILHDFGVAWGVLHTILPMTDSSVRTIVETSSGDLEFQEYFVRRKCEPSVSGFRFDGADAALPAPGALEALERADAVIICPSNPWVSIGPILAIPGIKGALADKRVLAVSPIIGGKAVKGPAAKMFTEMGIQPTALAVAEHYRPLASDYVLDRIDAALAHDVGALGMAVLLSETLMRTNQDRRRLAQEVLSFLRDNPR